MTLTDNQLIGKCQSQSTTFIGYPKLEQTSAASGKKRSQDTRCVRMNSNSISSPETAKDELQSFTLGEVMANSLSSAVSTSSGCSSNGCSQLISHSSVSSRNCSADSGGFSSGDHQRANQPLPRDDLELVVNESLYSHHEASRQIHEDPVVCICDNAENMSQFSAFTLKRKMQKTSRLKNGRISIAKCQLEDIETTGQAVHRFSGPETNRSHCSIGSMAKRNRAKVHHPLLLRSVPVPPPVVPLYKEVALFGDCADNHLGSSFARSTIVSFENVTCDRYKQTFGRQWESLDSGDITGEATNEQLMELRTSEKDNEADDMSISERQIGTAGRYFCERWQDLRNPAKVEQVAELPLNGPSTESKHEPRNSDARLASDTGTYGKFSSTISQRTGKFLEKLRQSLNLNPKGEDNNLEHPNKDKNAAKGDFLFTNGVICTTELSVSADLPASFRPPNATRPNIPPPPPPARVSELTPTPETSGQKVAIRDCVKEPNGKLEKSVSQATLSCSAQDHIQSNKWAPHTRKNSKKNQEISLDFKKIETGDTQENVEDQRESGTKTIVSPRFSRKKKKQEFELILDSILSSRVVNSRKSPEPKKTQVRDQLKSATTFQDSATRGMGANTSTQNEQVVYVPHDKGALIGSDQKLAKLCDNKSVDSPSTENKKSIEKVSKHSNIINKMNGIVGSQLLHIKGHAKATSQIHEAQNKKKLVPKSKNSDDIESQWRRDQTLQSSDVFIYPPTYRQMNECCKCLRDVKICNCNDTRICEPPAARLELNDTQADIKTSSQFEVNNNHERRSQGRIEDERVESNLASDCSSYGREEDDTIRDRVKIRGQNERPVDVANKEIHSCPINKDEILTRAAQHKTVYKISIGISPKDSSEAQHELHLPRPRVSPRNGICRGLNKCSNMDANNNCINHNPRSSKTCPSDKTNDQSGGYSNVDQPKTDSDIGPPSQEHDVVVGKLSNRRYDQENSYTNDELQAQTNTPVASSDGRFLDLNTQLEQVNQTIDEPAHFGKPQLSNQTNLGDSSNPTNKISSLVSPPGRRQRRPFEPEDLPLNPLLTSSSNSGDNIEDKISSDSTEPGDENKFIRSEKSSGEENVRDSPLAYLSDINNNMNICLAEPTECPLDNNRTSIHISNPIFTSIRELNPRDSEDITKCPTSVIPINSAPLNNRCLVLDSNGQVGGETFAEIRKRPSRNKILDQISFISEDLTRSQREQEKDVLEYSPILSTVRDYIENVNTELQIKSTPQQEPLQLELPTPSALDKVEKLVALSQGHELPDVIAATAERLIDSDSIATTIISTSSLLSHKELESPKKSIFEGASKDQILEYLEDARERVPQVLIAADDVMVISENELIVVNQLEPNSPATPISIIEDNEDIISGLSQSTRTNVTSDTNENLMSDSNSLYMKYSSASGTVTGHEALSQKESGLGSRLDSVCNSFDLGASGNNDIRAENFSLATESTSGSFEDQVSSSDIYNGDFGTNSECISTAARKQDRPPDEVEQMSKFHGRLLSLRHSTKKYPQKETNRSFSGTSRNSHVMLMNQNLDHKLHAARRNSTSGGISSKDRDRDRTIRMLLLARDSLSSSSSSPPSSSSPSSSNSSNRTSGECSAESNLYASSSLSCSSPFMDLNRMSPAFAKVIAPNNCPEIESELLELSKLSIGLGDSSIGDPLARLALKNSCEPTRSTLVPTKPNAALISSAILSGDGQVAKLGDDSVSEEKSSISKSELDSSDSNKSSDLSSHICLSSEGTCKEEPKLIDTKLLLPTAVTSAPNKRCNHALPLGACTNIVARSSHSLQATINRLNNYINNRQPLESEMAVDFQCLDCDQFICSSEANLMLKSNELRRLRALDIQRQLEKYEQSKPMTGEQLDRAYIAAMNGLPLCKSCDKKRIERKEIISEFAETEFKYGRDLKVIRDEFNRPMEIAGLLSKDQINGVFLNLEELIIANCKFSGRLESAISEAHSMGDQDLNTVNIGRLFIECAEMLHIFESYCVRQGAAACMLARLAKEKELLRIFLRVSQMENTHLRRMNLAAFLMVPVQRVTKYPLLLNRLYKVTAYHHKDREALRDAQLKVELHLEHINQQTKGVGATNKIWRRISNLSAPISSRRGLVSAEDIGYMKLRKTALDLLKWDRDQTQFIHSGKLNFAPLNEYLTKQKLKPIRYIAAHALLIVLGKPNWKYRPDLVKPSPDTKLITPTVGGNGIKEAVLLLFREKNNRFVPCREPLFLSNCVFSNDCSQYNNECPPVQGIRSAGSGTLPNGALITSRKSISGPSEVKDYSAGDIRLASAELALQALAGAPVRPLSVSSTVKSSSTFGRGLSSNKKFAEQKANGETNSQKSPIDSQAAANLALKTPRSFSLASALPRTPISTTGGSTSHLNKVTSACSSNLTILNQLVSKVNSYHRQAQTIKEANSEIASRDTQETVGPIGQTILSSVSTNHIDSNGAISSSGSPTSLDSQLESRARKPGNGTRSTSISLSGHLTGENQQPQYNHHFFHNHHQLYGDYEESFEMHERLTKESMLLRADTPLKTRYWLQMLKYHAKDLGQWRCRRSALPNIMMMRHE